MKKIIIVALLVAFVAVCITLAIASNAESDRTIERVDAEIARWQD